MLLETILMSALMATQTAAIQITKQTAIRNQYEEIEIGALSPGYFYIPPKATFTMAPTALLSLGNMTTFQMRPGGTCDLDGEAILNVGSYSLFTLDSACKFSMDKRANFVKFKNAQDGRSELYCNESFTLGGGSFVTMQPQSLIHTQAPFSVGKSIFVNLRQGAVLNIGHNTIIQDFAFVNLEEQARLDVLPSAVGVVTITSSHQKPPIPTSVHLYASSKIINEGQMTIGGGKSTKVRLFESGLLQIRKGGTFTIASSTFDIGPSSFWIINGTFFFDESSTLQSGLQSNITIDHIPGDKRTGVFKTLNGGNVTVGAGASFHLVGTSQITGTFVLSASSHVEIAAAGKLVLNDPGATFTLGYASTATIEGILTVNRGGAVSVGAFAGINIGANAHITLNAPFVLGERSYFSLNFPGHTFVSCFNFGAIKIAPYTHTVITEVSQAHSLGLTCGAVP